MKKLHAQQGVSLLVVVVIALLGALLVLASTQVVRLEEMLAGNDSEAAWGFEAAEALLHDAELDVLGLQPNGQPCQAGGGVAGCRSGATTTLVPSTVAEFNRLALRLSARVPPCADGICLNLGAAATADSGTGFWSDATSLKTQVTTAGGVPYGLYSGARASDNPLLQTSDRRGAWYWIEVLPYNAGAAVGGGDLAPWSPTPSDPFIFRLTAVVQGRRPGATTVLQSMLVRQVLGSP